MRALAAVLLLAALASPGEEVVADLSWDEWTHDRYPRGRVALSEDAPTGIEPPADEDLELRWAIFGLADHHTLIFAVEFKEGKARVWVDTNFDRELKEDPVEMRPTRTALHVKVELRLPKRKVNYHIYRFKNDADGVVRVTGAAHRAGSVVLEGRLRPIQVVDNNGDQRFDQPGTRFYFDLNGDGKASEQVTIGKPFRVRDHGYVVRVPGRTAPRVVFEQVAKAPSPPVLRWYKRGGGVVKVRKAPQSKFNSSFRALYDKATERDGERYSNYTYNRAAVLDRIGTAGTKEAFGFLHARYRKARDSSLQMAAVHAMGYADYVAFVARVASIARTAKDPGVRRAAIVALHRMGAPGRAKIYLSILQRDKEARVAESAARHLAAIRTAAAWAMLSDGVTGLPRRENRHLAYFAATRFRRNAPPKDLVLTAAQAKDPQLRALGLQDARTLGFVETPGLALAAAGSGVMGSDLRLVVIEILASRASAPEVWAVMPLADGAAPAARGRLIDLLRLVRDPAATGAIVESLDAKLPAVRAAAAEIVAHLPDARAAPALAARIEREPNEDALVALMRAAAEHRVAAAAPAIVAAARKSRSDRVRAATLRALARIGFENPAVRAYYEGRLKSRSWEQQIIVLDVAAASGDPAAAEFLIPYVGHKTWQVRLVSAQGLGVVRVKKAVRPLIGRLAEEKNKRVKRAVADTLFRITGKQLYDMADLWMRWWADNAADFEVPKTLPGRDGVAKKDESKSVVTFYGVPVASEHIIFVIDQSGSMSSSSRYTATGDRGDKNQLQRAVDETLNVVDKLPDAAKVNVILFESDIHPWRRELVRLTSRTKKQLERHLRKQEPTGGTNLYDGLEMALLTDGVDAIYLLSDGSPGSGKFVAKDDIVREIKKLNKTRRVQIHCVSLGRDSDLLSELAKQNGGSYVQR